MAKFAVVAGLALVKTATGVSLVWAAAKRWVVPKGTDPNTLLSRDPDKLDTRNLEVTPIDGFRTMGETQYAVDLNTWRLKIDGAVQKPVSITYEQLTARPAFEKKVLLICPGVFAYVGLWKGVDIGSLLSEAGAADGVTQVKVSGPADNERAFPIKDIQDGKVFLAYGVNGIKLPQKHGYPLRVVAQDNHGSDWVKYVDRITAVKD